MRTTSIATLAYASLLLLAAVIPGEIDGPTPPFTSLEPVRAIDLLHVPAYGLLAWLVLAMLRDYGITWGKGIVVAVTLAILCGTTVELLQHMVPGRVASLLDCVLNGIGAAAGATLYFIVDTALRSSPTSSWGRTTPGQAP